MMLFILHWNLLPHTYFRAWLVEKMTFTVINDLPNDNLKKKHTVAVSVMVKFEE